MQTPKHFRLSFWYFSFVLLFCLSLLYDSNDSLALDSLINSQDKSLTAIGLGQVAPTLSANPKLEPIPLTPELFHNHIPAANSIDITNAIGSKRTYAQAGGSGNENDTDNTENTTGTGNSDDSNDSTTDNQTEGADIGTDTTGGSNDETTSETLENTDPGNDTGNGPDSNFDLSDAGAGGGMNQGSEDLGDDAGSTGMINMIMGAVLIAIGIVLLFFFPPVGVVLIAMGLMMLAQAAADSEGESGANAVNSATNIRIPKFNAKNLKDLNFDNTSKGQSIFGDGSGVKSVKSIIEDYRKKGYSYDSKTKLMTTPNGIFRSSDFGNVDGLKKMGLTEEQAKKVLGIAKAVYNKTLNGDYGPIGKRGKKGKKKGNGSKALKKNEAFGDAETGGGAGASSNGSNLKRPSMGRLKMLATKGPKRKGGFGKTGPNKDRMYYGTPVGGRMENIFDLVKKTYKKKDQEKYFIKTKY